MFKNELVKININNINLDLPDLKDIKESKAIVVAKWLMRWIKTDLKSKKIRPQQLLPTKAEFAYMLGVSVGTVQNALRYIEDLGFVESKQRIGTLIKGQENSSIKKLTSKREIAVEKIKQYIIDKNIQIGNNLPSVKVIATNINTSSNTTRAALEYLCSNGVLTHKFKNSNETGWTIKTLTFDINSNSKETLVNKITDELKEFISNELKVGDKMPAHEVLAQKLNVSIKTIHDGLNILKEENIILARRGRYGSTVIKMPNEMHIEPEISIFAPAKDAAFYYYEKTQNHIKRMISENYQIGSKLPSINEISKQMDLSPNTIRHAFHNLAKEGYLAFSRGRYGGTFVIDIPETEEQAFKWLAVNPKYANIYKN